MQYIHFRQKVTTNGEKTVKTTVDGSEKPTLNNKTSNIRSKRIGNKLQANYIDNQIIPSGQYRK